MRGWGREVCDGCAIPSKEVGGCGRCMGQDGRVVIHNCNALTPVSRSILYACNTADTDGTTSSEWHFSSHQ